MTVMCQKYELWNVKWSIDYYKVHVEGGGRVKDVGVNFSLATFER